MLTVAEFREAARRVVGPAVRCPHCAGSLRQPPHPAIVLASRHCPHCGRRVLAEPDNMGTLALTVEDVSNLRAWEDRFRQRLLWPAAVALFGMPLVILVLALFRDTLLTALAPVADEQIVKDGLVGLMLAPLLIGSGWIAVLALRAGRRVGRCPHCSAHYFAQLLAATGNCGQCGGRVAARPKEPAIGPLLQLNDVRAASRRVSRAVGLRFGGGFAGTAVLIVVFVGVSVAFDRFQAFWSDVERLHGVMNAAYIRAVAETGVCLLVWAPALVGLVGALRVRPEVRCPPCGAAVGGGGLVVASKCCTGCGRRVLADPQPTG